MAADPRTAKSASTPPAPKNKSTKQSAGPAMKTDSPPAAENGATQPLLNETMNIDPAEEARGAVTMDSSSEDTADPTTSKTLEHEVEPDSDPGKGATTLGDYKLLKELGRGGMGTVYKAHQISLDRVVAIKVLSKDLVNKKDFVARFKREAILMAKLDHPNVLRCFEVKQDKGFHYIAIEFIEGGSVEGWLKKLGRFSIGDALHIALKTLDALQHAHEKSLIHRDIKPDNLLLTKAGVVKVADLGLAKNTEDDVSLTKSGAGAGTPIYMAPEQAYNVKHVDCRADIYAIGVMIYVFLTGRAPFDGATPMELMVAKEKGKFDPIRKHNDEVPPRLDLIVDKMLAKDAKDRYASCEEVINELEPLGLANDRLSFLESETPAVKRDVKLAAMKKPAASASPQKAAAKSPAKPSPADAAAEKDVWYWTMVSKSGQPIPKRVTTEQLKTLIKAGHLDAQAQISKTLTGGYRAAATYMEFHGLFQSKETVTKANVKGQKYREIYKDIEAADARKRRWGWLGRSFKGVGGTIIGLVWIILILGVAGGAAYFAYTKFLAAP